MTFDDWWKSEGFEFDPEAKSSKWLALYAWQAATKSDREVIVEAIRKLPIEQVM